MINDNDNEVKTTMQQQYAAIQLQIADAVRNFQNGGMLNRTGREMLRLQKLVDALPKQPDDADGFSEDEILKLHKAILAIPRSKSDKAEQTEEYTQNETMFRQ